MIGRTPLLLIVLLAVHVFYLRPRAEERGELLVRARKLAERIRREETIRDQQNTIAERLKANRRISAQNARLLYPKAINSSAAMGRFEELVKSLASKSGLETIRSEWGEPEAIEADYVRLPIHFHFRGAAAETAAFLRESSALRPKARVQTLTIRKERDEALVMDVILVAWQVGADAPLTTAEASSPPEPSPPGALPPGFRPPSASGTGTAKFPPEPPPGWPEGAPWPPKRPPSMPGRGQ
jgi:Tfp pilus assembly protein PilO